MKRKTTKSQKHKQKKRLCIDEAWELINPHAAGVDIGSREHWACVPKGAAAQPVRRFGTFTPDLEAMADWFAECGVSTVAMEATGVYWISLFQILERRGFKVLLANARQTKNVSGRKSDVLDCQWIQRLHTYGLLQGSFRPADAYCRMRTYLRYRDELVGGRSTQCQHLFVLQQAYDLYRFYDQKIALCEEQIVQELVRLPGRAEAAAKPLPPRKAGRTAAQDRLAGQDLRSELYKQFGVDLTALEGIGVFTALTVFTEVGPDVNRFPSEKHFCSWLGVCPDNRISGGKVLSSRTRRVVNRLSDALRMAATTLERSQSALGGYYRRMKARLGAAEGITATAHKLARIIYRMLKYGEAYVRQGLEEYERKFRARKLASLKRNARTLGFELIEKQSLPHAVS